MIAMHINLYVPTLPEFSRRLCASSGIPSLYPLDSHLRMYCQILRRTLSLPYADCYIRLRIRRIALLLRERAPRLPNYVFRAAVL
jgi:hypothetical protein